MLISNPCMLANTQMHYELYWHWISSANSLYIYQLYLHYMYLWRDNSTWWKATWHKPVKFYKICYQWDFFPTLVLLIQIACVRTYIWNVSNLNGLCKTKLKVYVICHMALRKLDSEKKETESKLRMDRVLVWDLWSSGSDTKKYVAWEAKKEFKQLVDEH